ncbi:MAG: AbrB/MazE/SpoVT family DNA-binding domain-containing protein [Chloroflexia bacterium]
MSGTIGKWGNNLAVCIPDAYAEQLHWDENTSVFCTVVNGQLVIAPAAAPVYDLDQLVAGITPENRHDEIRTGSAVGNEAW